MLNLFAPIQKLLQTPNIQAKTTAQPQPSKQVEYKPLKASIPTTDFDDLPEDYHKIKIDTNSRKHFVAFQTKQKRDGKVDLILFFLVIVRLSGINESTFGKSRVPSGKLH
jgi:hypothetical protein